MKKRILSIVLILCMVFMFLPITVYADEIYGNFYYTVSDDKVTITRYTGSETDVNIPSQIDSKPVVSIGPLAFSERPSLKSVTIPNGVTSIGESAFRSCRRLESITIPNGVTSIGEGAFSECSSLKSITIPSSVTLIGGSTFYGCTSLERIAIPSGVTSIGPATFYGCSQLKSIMLPDSVVSIGNDTFENCTSLTSITIPYNVTSIGNYVFKNCTSLTSITIPYNVTSIGNYAFENCNLEIIFLPDNQNLTIGEDAIPTVATTTQVKYSLDTDRDEITITGIELEQDTTGVDIPDKICGYPVVAAEDGLLTNISSHTCAGGTATCQTKATCGICKQEYGEIDNSNHNYEKTPAKAATVTETGNIEYWQCKDCKKYFADENGTKEIKLADTVIQKLPSEIIEGKGQTITAGDKNDITFRSNAAFSDFIRVELDGKILDEKNYTVKEGSTIVTLKADYVATLSAGKHTIGIVSTNGTATTTFTVNENIETTTSPQTADNNIMWIWFGLMFVSGTGFAGVTFYSKRREVE